VKRNWELDELIEHFTILPNEMQLIENKTGETRIGFREDTIEMATWLCQNVLYHDHDLEHLKERVYSRFRELKIVPPTPDRIERLIRSAIHTYEGNFYQVTYQKLPSSTLSRLDSLIESIAYLETDDEAVSVYSKLAITDAQEEYNGVINKFPV
jgi:hypothetical protein